MRWPSLVQSPAKAFLLLALVHQAYSSGVFELRLQSFTNDLGRDSEGKCCSGMTSSTSSSSANGCTGVCRTYFRVCFTHYQTNVDTHPPCTYGDIVTPVLGNNSVNVTDTVLTTSGFVNPIRFPFEFSWPNTFSLIVEAWHQPNQSVASTTFPASARGPLIMRLTMQRWLAVGDTWENNVHRDNHTVLRFAFRVRCDEHHYGPGCAVTCRPRDDKFGHFTCSEQGGKVCLPGWTGDYCDVAVCAPGCNAIHGECSVPNECKCRMGWQGKSCDQCIRYPGCMQGTCDQPWQCNCKEGWGGLFCNQDLNYCTNHKPCKNGGTCTNTGQGSYTCACPAGFGGTDCDVVVDDCAHQPCLNGGTCSGPSANYTCSCPAGFRGSRCESAASTCSERPCVNGGTCISGPNGYECRCRQGYEGVNCERQADDCSPNPCLNGGQCKDMAHGYRCTCSAGFSGPNCEWNVDDCQRNPCLNGGTCADMVNSFKCICMPGFMGDLCQTNMDECLFQPCANGATCHDLVHDFRCTCKPGFTGKDCSVNVNECASSPCFNGATCLDRVNGFRCSCSQGYTGLLCESPLTEAVNNTSSKASLDSGSSGSSSRNFTGSASSSSYVAESLSTQQVIVVATLVPVVIVVLVGVACYLGLRHRRAKKEQRRHDEKVRHQNEHNAVHGMNNKCLDNQIVNVLVDSKHKCNNEGGLSVSAIETSSGTTPCSCTVAVVNVHRTSGDSKRFAFAADKKYSQYEQQTPPPTNTPRTVKHKSPNLAEKRASVAIDMSPRLAASDATQKLKEAESSSACPSSVATVFVIPERVSRSPPPFAQQQHRHLATQV